MKNTMKAVKRSIQSLLVAILIVLAAMTGMIFYYNVLRAEDAPVSASGGRTERDAQEEPPVGPVPSGETETEGTEETFSSTEESMDGETEEAAHEHIYTSLVLKPATCAEEGEVEYVCDLCDDSYREVIPTLEHTAGEWFTAREATASQTGLRQRICSVCGRVLEEETIPAVVADTVPVSVEDAGGSVQESAHEHSYISEITREATCTERGEETFTCTQCGDIFTKSIPATNHPSRRTIRTDGDCGEPGSVETICNLCNAVISSEALYYDHTWGEWEKTDGSKEKTRKCKVCGEIQTKKGA